MLQMIKQVKKIITPSIDLITATSVTITLQILCPIVIT